jgi:hypothetical protein
VFYTTNGGLHGLEAAPENLSAGASWGCYGTDIAGAEGTIIGTGAQNTADILAGCPDRPIAASIAAEYAGPNLDSLGEWFLPSKDELNEIYLNNDVMGGFGSVELLSSSENDDWAVWGNYGVGCCDGVQGLFSKTYAASHNVRAVRAF